MQAQLDRVKTSLAETTINPTSSKRSSVQCIHGEAHRDEHVPFNELMAGQSPAVGKAPAGKFAPGDKEVKATARKTPDEILASNDP